MSKLASHATAAGLLLVATTLGCADRSATQYIGSVTREDAPQSAGSMRLTFFSRTDTSFSGVMELGEPARGTGSAYAWFEGPELHIVTVGAYSPDTILWTSRLSDTALGGSFEMLGGDREGQKGTWRARLVRGLPATQATLSAPTRTALPTTTSGIVALLALIAIGFGTTAWIRRAPKGIREDGSRWVAPPAPLNGTSGWLAFFIVAQVFAILFRLSRTSETWSEYVTTVRVATAATGAQALIVVETAIGLIALPLIIGGLVLIVRRSAYTSRYWYAYYAISILYVVVDVVWARVFKIQVDHLVAPDGSDPLGSMLVQQLSQAVGSAIWAGYWATSRRVRATFGAAALDKTVIPWPEGPVPSAAAPTNAPRGPRWWGRMALRALGVLVGVS